MRFRTATARDETPEAWDELVQRVLQDQPVAVCALLPEAAEPPALKQLCRGGPLVVLISAQRLDLPAYAHVLVNWPDGAEQLGRNLPAILGERRNYLLVHARSRGPLGDHCYERFIPAAAVYYDRRRLEEADMFAAHRPPADLIRDMFDRFRSAGVVITLDPSPWLATRPSFALDPGQRFATLGAPPALWPRLRSGEAAALVGPLDGDIGYAAFELALEGLTGSGETGRVRWIECELVTVENLNDFARRYAASANVTIGDLVPAGTATAEP